jgi:hypothetical protein
MEQMRHQQKSHRSLLEPVTWRWMMTSTMRTWTPGFAPHALVAQDLHVVSANEPASFAEAEHNPSWRKAMMEEMDSIEENGT